jgi:hypothetical protein
MVPQSIESMSQYNPKLPDDSVNVSSESFVWQMIKMMAGLLIVFIIFYTLLIVSTNLIVSYITPEYESKLLSFVEHSHQHTNDDKYLQSVAQKVTQCVNLAYEVQVNSSNKESGSNNTVV